MIRFALATAAGAVALVLALLLRQERWLAIEVMTYTAVVALGVGFFAARRGWLAASASVTVAAALLAGMSIGTARERGTLSAPEFLSAVVPLVAVATIFGSVGGWTRSKIVRR